MSDKYEVVIGLEVHAELNTASKIFCGCENKFGAEPNTLCCPVCTGMPGTLPVLNTQVAEYAIKMGHALNCKINHISKLDRKNYFYPDLPKAYQISQFDVPVCEDGHLDIVLDGKTHAIGITRIHIEEDAGKLIHDDETGGTLADYNRCGVPLIEIVSEPDLRSAAQAKLYMETIADTLLYLGISNAKMQEGNLRADVNVSVRPVGSKELTTRVEMKNVNSFSAVFRAVEYEANRQIEIIEAGGEIAQETRRWDDVKGTNIVMRTKEDAQDYRYFPDPDLLTFEITQERVEELKLEIPELPLAKKARYVEQFALSEYDAGLLSGQKQRADFFDAAVGIGTCDAKTIANWLLGDILKILNDKKIELQDTALTPQNLTKMLDLIQDGTISGTAAKKVLDVILKEDADPSEVVKEKGLAQISDTSALNEIVNSVLENNPKAVEDFKNGKKNVMAFLVGQCMKQSKGQGNPAVLRELLETTLQNM